MKTLKILWNGLITFVLILPFVCLIYRPYLYLKYKIFKSV